MNQQYLNPNYKNMGKIAPFKYQSKRIVEKGSYLNQVHQNCSNFIRDMVSSIEYLIMDGKEPSFDEVAGLDNVKRLLYESVQMPVQQPELFQSENTPTSSLLIYGAPGTGKTLLAKSIGALKTSTVFKVSDLSMRIRNQSQVFFPMLFDMAKYYSPSTIIIDDFDSICINYYETENVRRLKTELMVQLDLLAENREHLVFVVAITNRPWNIDYPLLRRFEKTVYASLPNYAERRQMFEMFLSDMKTSSDIDWNLVSEMSEGYTGSDISTVCKEATMIPIRGYFSMYNGIDISKKTASMTKLQIDVAINMQMLVGVIDSIGKSISEEEVKRFADWMDEYGLNLESEFIIQ